MLALRAHRNPDPALADLLNWAALVDPGVVQCKSGAFLTGFFYQGLDPGSAADTDRNYQSDIVNQALAALGSGWCIWSEMIRMPAAAYPPEKANHFPDPASRMIDAERRATYQAEGQHFVTDHVLVAMYTPPSHTANTLRDRLTGDAHAQKQDAGHWPQERLDTFNRTVIDLQDRLSQVLRIRRFGGYTGQTGAGGDDMLDYLAFCLTGDQTSWVAVPPDGMYIDALIVGTADLTVGATPVMTMDGTADHIVVISIAGLPSATWPNMMASLETLPAQVRWSTRMIFMDQSQAIKEIDKYRKTWKQKSRGFFSQLFSTNTGAVNQDALLMAAEAEAAMTEAHSDLVRFGYYTSTLALRHRDSDSAMEQAREIRKAIQSIGCLARIETLNAMEAWLGSLPGHPHANIRRPLIHTLNLANLMPLSHVWPGEENCPNPLYPPNSPPLMIATAVGATPFRLHLHVQDVGHTLIFGPTGTGKSTLLCALAAQFWRYPGARIFAFDQGRSMETLVSACGGTHYHAGADADRMAPLSDIETPADLDWAAAWIASLCELQQGTAPDPSQKEAIAGALKQLTHAKKKERSLTDFRTTVQHKAVRQALDQYCADEAILDGPEDDLQLSDFVVVEVDELLKRRAEQYLPVFDYLFRRLERSLDGSPALLILGEAWNLLAHPTFQPKIREWLKTFRKLNCAVIIETQSLSDAVDSGLFDVLMESCPTKILLPNPAADQAGSEQARGPRDYYVSIGLNDADIALIKHAIPKRQYYHVSPVGRRLIDLELGPVARALCAVSDRETLARRTVLQEQSPETWLRQWLTQEAGVTP